MMSKIIFSGASVTFEARMDGICISTAVDDVVVMPALVDVVV